MLLIRRFNTRKNRKKKKGEQRQVGNTHRNHSLLYAVGVCVVYSVLSGWCVIHNKFILANVFPDSNCLLLVQNVFTLLFVALGKTFLGLKVNVRLSSMEDWVVGFAYSLNVLCGLWSLHFLIVPMFSALKRCNVIVVWIIEFLFARRETTLDTFRALLVLLGGTFIASYHDLQFSAVGYALAIASCIFQGSSFELGRRFVEKKGDTWSALTMNSLASLCMQVVFLTLSGSIVHLLPSNLSSRQLFHLALNAVSCMLMNYAIILNCTVNSSLAHAVTGNVKAIATTAVSIAFFHLRLTGPSYVGLGISFLGAAWFSVVKYRAEMLRQRKKNREDERSAEEEGADVTGSDTIPACDSPFGSRHGTGA